MRPLGQEKTNVTTQIINSTISHTPFQHKPIPWGNAPLSKQHQNLRKHQKTTISHTYFQYKSIKFTKLFILQLFWNNSLYNYKVLITCPKWAFLLHKKRYNTAGLAESRWISNWHSPMELSNANELLFIVYLMTDAFKRN